MKDFFDEEFDDFELEYMPLTRQLLLNHILWEFEGETETDDYTLKYWLFELKKNGRLHELVSAEWVYSPGRHQRYETGS